MHEKSNNPNTTDDAADQQEYERFFPELDLTPEEDDFFHDMMIQRMEMHDHLHKQRNGIDIKAQALAWLAEDKDFDDLLKRLPHEESLIINRHDANLNNRHADRCDFYYRAGFMDGLKLARFVREA